MSRVKEAIEEMIEESYLLGLSEDEIRQDFSRFIDTCYTVVQTHVRDRAAVSGLAEDLARERTCVLIADRNGEEGAGTGSGADSDAAVQTPREQFAERVARRKRLILRTIGAYDPRLVRLIDEQRFQVDFGRISRRRGQPRPRPRLDWERHRMLLLSIGYAFTVVLIILLIYLNFVQSI